MLKELNTRADAPWKDRYRAPSIAMMAIASQNPDRGIVVTNKDGIYQIYAWDVKTGQLTQRTQQPEGLRSGYISADGQWIYYLHDEQGNEIGHYFKMPFTGGEATDITPDFPAYASNYITESHSGNLLGIGVANQHGFQIYAIDPSGNTQFSYQNPAWSAGPNLSHDGTIAVIATTEKSQSTDFNLEAYDIASGEKLGELWDGTDTSITPIGFVPRAGDERYLCTTNRSGFTRPVIWNPRTGERIDIELPEVEGEVLPQDWSEDGRYLLVSVMSHAVQSLYRYDIETKTMHKIPHASGTFTSMYFRPDNKLHSIAQTAQRNAHVIEIDLTTGEMQTILDVGQSPTGYTWENVNFASEDGTPIQAWLIKPEGEGPFPTIVHTHGGPTAVQVEMYFPGALAWVDHGFAWFSINYRGSMTFGSAFQTAINGRLGELEVDDIAAGVQWLLDEGISQPDMILKTGGSYGGYLTLMALSKKPDLWVGGMAVVAIADWVMMYDDMAETLRGYQRSLFGSSPEENPEQHKKASPASYSDAIQADLLVIQGRNDTRCPSRQMQVYEQQLKEKGKNIQVEWFDAGHGALRIEEQIKHQEMMMRFAYRVLG